MLMNGCSEVFPPVLRAATKAKGGGVLRGPEDYKKRDILYQRFDTLLAVLCGGDKQKRGDREDGYTNGPFRMEE